jgi:hypothetical protein
VKPDVRDVSADSSRYPSTAERFGAELPPGIETLVEYRTLGDGHTWRQGCGHGRCRQCRGARAYKLPTGDKAVVQHSSPCEGLPAACARAKYKSTQAHERQVDPAAPKRRTA